MPELPEVEVVKRSLISKTQNLTVKEAATIIITNKKDLFIIYTLLGLFNFD